MSSLALAQRRDVDARDREPEVEVGAERALVRLGAQVAVGRRDDAHVDLDVFLAADAAERPPLEHAQQRRLDRQRQLADLVEEDRTAVRQLERALLPAIGAGERAALVPEQVGRDQRRAPARRRRRR